MIKPLFKYSAFLLVVLFLAASLQHTLLTYLFPNRYDADIIPQVYALWFALSVAGFAPVFWMQKKKNKNTGFAYLVTSIIKMFGGLTLLLPILLEPNDKNTFFSLNFVVAFFIILLFELIYYIKLTENEEKKPT